MRDDDTRYWSVPGGVVAAYPQQVVYTSAQRRYKIRYMFDRLSHLGAAAVRELAIPYLELQIYLCIHMIAIIYKFAL